LLSSITTMDFMWASITAIGPKCKADELWRLLKISHSSFDQTVVEDPTVASPFDFHYSMEVMVVLNPVKSHKSPWPANESNPFSINILNGGLDEEIIATP
jgi:hypothetical protein